MPPTDQHDRPAPDAVAILDAVIDHVAEEEAENGVSTAQEVRWAHDLRRKMQSHIAALRRQLTPVQPIVRRSVPIGSEIRALDREGLLAQLEALRQVGDLRYAHQDLTGLSDADLRRMLAILMEPTEG
jgi:hypothetical protein